MKAANIIRIIVFVFLIVGIATAVTYRKQFDVDVLGDWLAGAGVMAPLLFIGIYAISTVLLMPGSVLTIAGSALFGPVWGTFYNLTGAIAHTYLGYAGRNAVAGGEGMIQKALLGLGLLAFVAFLPRLIKRLRRC